MIPAEEARQRATHYKTGCEELIAAIDLITSAWDGGDLAGAVNEASATAEAWRE